MKRKSLYAVLALVLSVIMSLEGALAATLTLPTGVKVIEEEAFYGDDSLDQVVLPEGVEEIGPRAFADSSLTSINLPDSLTGIAEDAFDEDVAVEANEGTYAYDWAVNNGYIIPEGMEGWTCGYGPDELAITVSDSQPFTAGSIASLYHILYNGVCPTNLQAAVVDNSAPDKVSIAAYVLKNQEDTSVYIVAGARTDHWYVRP